jgi:predicted transposase YbfD/YdcC
MKYTAKNKEIANRGREKRVSYGSLREAFASIADPRRETNNKTYSLEAMLLAIVAGLLSGQTSILGCAEWLAEQELRVKQALGFATETTPHQSTFQRLLSKLAANALERALTGYFEQSPVGEIKARGSEAIAIDGKCQRGRLKFEEEGGVPVHLLSLFCQSRELVLAQREIERGKSEYSTAPSLIAQIEWIGRVLTGDAAFCYKEISGPVVKAGGDYFLTVKANQPTLQAEIELVFDTKLLPAGLPFDLRPVKQVDKGHGRVEIRTATATAELAHLSEWAYLAQVVAIKREWLCKGVWKAETTYCVTSLPKEVADVEALLMLKRGHWGIENKLHWVRDVVFGEDKSLIHKGQGGQVMAALRNTALNLIRKAGFSKIKATLRKFACDVHKVLALLGCSA